MKILFIFFMIVGCDSVTINYQVGRCMEHNWAYKGVYKVTRRDNMKIYLENITTKEKIKISAMDKGWNEVSCQ